MRLIKVVIMMLMFFANISLQAVDVRRCFDGAMFVGSGIVTIASVAMIYINYSSGQMPDSEVIKYLFRQGSYVEPSVMCVLHVAPFVGAAATIDYGHRFCKRAQQKNDDVQKLEKKE